MHYNLFNNQLSSSIVTKQKYHKIKLELASLKPSEGQVYELDQIFCLYCLLSGLLNDRGDLVKSLAHWLAMTVCVCIKYTGFCEKTVFL